MPRNYGRTRTAIWRDKDFRTLTPEARFTYTMLFNQPNVTAVGVLELTVTRWGGNTGYPTSVIGKALAELVEHHYLVIDEDTEEVFIRSFVKHDGGANNDLRRKAIQAAAAAVVSDTVRASIAVELDRIGVPHALSKPLPGPIEARRVVVNKGDHRNNPQPTTREGEPEPFDEDVEPLPWCSKHPGGTEDPCGPCGSASRRWRHWHETKPQRDAAARQKAQERAQVARDCPACDPDGWQLNDQGEPTARRCTHRRTA